MGPRPKPNHIELGDGTLISILYEDRSVLALDKPPGWMLVPHSWQRTQRNLQAAIVSAIGQGHFWARSRNLRFLRYVHRLDAETSGILLFGKSQGAVETLSRLFESRAMEKVYLAVVAGRPARESWSCQARLAPDSRQIGRMKIDPRGGKEAETHFLQLAVRGDRTLIEARPVTGRTHQIRLHLFDARLPIVGDDMYGVPVARTAKAKDSVAMGLRAIALSYQDPFTRRPVTIQAPTKDFLNQFGFSNFQAPSTAP